LLTTAPTRGGLREVSRHRLGHPQGAWCTLDATGEVAEGAISADEEGLARLAHRLGPEVSGCIEMMSGAVWVRDRLRACGWTVEIADARKVKAIAPLACKTDRVDARVLAELVRRDLSPGCGCHSRTGRLSKAGPNRLRWVAVEAAQQAWRPTSP
jgi:hypothetical protein